MKADPTPLKVSATPNKDGTTDVNYYTKHTVGSEYYHVYTAKPRAMAHPYFAFP